MKSTRGVDVGDSHTPYLSPGLRRGGVGPVRDFPTLPQGKMPEIKSLVALFVALSGDFQQYVLKKNISDFV